MRLLAALLVTAGMASAATKPLPVTIREQGVLYTGGEVSGDGMSGQMHVFYQIPARVPPRHYPIVFIHGSRLTGAGFLGTPDGRPG